MPRVSKEERQERDDAAEALVLAGWSSEGVKALAERFGVAKRTVRDWRIKAAERIRARARPGATQAASLEEALERLEIVWTRALRDGDLKTARAVAWDRARLLDLVPRNRIEVGGNVTIDVNARHRVDVSPFPRWLLEAVARGVSDDELEELIEANPDDDLAGLLGAPVIPVEVVEEAREAHAERVGSEDA